MEETEVTYHAVEKDGVVTAIWEMKGRKHQRTREVQALTELIIIG